MLVLLIVLVLQGVNVSFSMTHLNPGPLSSNFDTLPFTQPTICNQVLSFDLAINTILSKIYYVYSYICFTNIQHEMYYSEALPWSSMQYNWVIDISFENYCIFGNVRENLIFRNIHEFLANSRFLLIKNLYRPITNTRSQRHLFTN